MDGDNDANDQREDRPRGVSKAKLASLDLDAKINIFHKINNRAVNTPLILSFPKEAATLFCNKIFKYVSNAEKNKDKVFAYTIVGGDKTAFESIFAWIMECIQQESILKYPEIPEPEDAPFSPTIEIIKAGKILDVPAGSLSHFLEKRLNFIARKHLMPFSEVEDFYTVDSDAYKLGLQSIAAVSVFNAWWDCRIDESVTPDLMEQLSDLRDAYPDLDKDLHDAFDDKKNAIEANREKKRLEREAEQNGGGQGNEADGWGQSYTEGADAAGGWDNSTTETGHDSTATATVADWERETVENAAAFGDWDKPDVKVSGNDWQGANEPAGGGDWADEVNEQEARPTVTVAPSVAW